MEKRAMALFITTCILPHLDVAVNGFFAFLRKKCGGKGAGEAGEVPRKTEGLNPLSRGKPRQLPLMQSRGAFVRCGGEAPPVAFGDSPLLVEGAFLWGHSSSKAPV